MSVTERKDQVSEDAAVDADVTAPTPPTGVEAPTTTDAPADRSAADQPRPLTPREFEELLRLRSEVGKYRQERSEAQRAAKAAEEARLKEQGEFKTLFEEREQQLAALQSELAEERRLERARTACEAARLPAAWAHRLTGDTDAELAADAQRMAAELPRPVAPSTEAGQGVGHGHAGPGLPPDQAETYLRDLGIRVPKAT